MMSFSIPLAPCNANTGASDITCTQSHVSPNFEHFDFINAMVP